MPRPLSRFAPILSTALTLAAGTHAHAQAWTPTLSRDVYFVLDGSESISTATFASERALVQEVILNDIPRLGTHRVGVIVFSSSVNTIVPLTFVTNANAASIAAAVGAAVQPKSSSFMKDAMRAVYDQYKLVSPSNINKLCVLITDGTPNPVSTQSPCSIKVLFASQSIRTIIVGLAPNFVNTQVKCLVDSVADEIGTWPTLGDEAEDFITKSFISCPADLTGDRFVDDSDFSSFAAAYNELVVPPANPLADFNRDGFVDDSDFVIFADYYDNLVCPGHDVPG